MIDKVEQELREELNQILLSTPSHQHDYTIDQILAKAEPLIREEGFAQGIEHYRKVILPVMVEEARKDERERVIKSLNLLVKKEFNLKDAISALEDAIEEQALKGEG